MTEHPEKVVLEFESKGTGKVGKDIEKLAKQVEKIGDGADKLDWDAALTNNIKNLKLQGKYLLKNTDFNVNSQKKIRRSISLTSRQKVGEDYMLATTGTWRNIDKSRFSSASRITPIRRKVGKQDISPEEKEKAALLKKQLDETRLKARFAPKLTSSDLFETDSGKSIRTTKEWKKVTNEQAEVLKKEGIQIRDVDGQLEALRETTNRTTKNIPRFKTELLSLMFISQQLNQSFAGLMNTGLKLTGMFEVMPLIIGGAMLPAMLPLSNMIMNLGLGFLDLDPNIQLVIGSLVVIGYGITKFLSIYSQLGMLKSNSKKLWADLFGNKKKPESKRVKGEIGVWKSFTTKLVKWLTPAGRAVKKLYDGFNKFFKSKRAMGNLIGMWGAMGKAAKSLSTTVLALGGALGAGLSTPLGLVATGILLLVALWWWLGDEIKKDPLEDHLKPDTTFGDSLKSAFTGLKEWVGKLALGDKVGELLTSIETTLTTWKTKLHKAFYDLLPEWIKNPTSTWETVTTSIETWLKGLPSKILAFAQGVKDSILGLFPSWSEITAKFGQFAGIVGGIVSKITTAVTGPRVASQTEIRGTQSLVDEYKRRNPGKTKEDYFRQYPNDAWIKDKIAGGFLSSPYTTKSGVVYEGIHRASGMYDMNSGKGTLVTYSPVIQINATINNDVDLRRMADKLDVMMQDRMRKYVRGT